MARSSAMLLALLLLPACAPPPTPRCPEIPPAAKSASPPPAPKPAESAAPEAPPDDGARFRLSVRAKPIVDPVASVEVEITARGPASDLDEWTLAAAQPGSVRSVTAQDIDGPIAVTMTEDAPSANAAPRGATAKPAPVHLRLARPPLGPLRLAYTVNTKPNSLASSPLVELDPDRFRAQGDALIALPDGSEDGPFAVSFTVDSAELGEAIRVASSLGVGSSRDGVMSATDLHQMVILAGHMGTALFNATEGKDEAAWVGYTTFDPRPIAADVASFRTAVGQLFREPIPGLSTLMIVADGRAPGAFVAGRRSGGVLVHVGVGEPWTAPVRIAVAAEIIKAWIGERLFIGPTEPEREAEAFWFTEGVTRRLAHDLLFRFGLISTTELLDEVNGLESVLALSPLKNESNASLAKRIKEPGALPLLVARGALYAARVDATLRAKSKGAKDADKASLETLLRGLYAKARDKRGPLPVSEWTSAIAKIADEKEADAWKTVIGDGKDVGAPDDALGPCFKGGSRRYEAFDLGFDLDATRKSEGENQPARVAGVRAGGPAAKAGLRDGDKLLDSKLTQGRSDVPVALTIERDGAKKSITYRPAGPAVNGHGWTRLKNVPDEACIQ